MKKAEAEQSVRQTRRTAAMSKAGSYKEWDNDSSSSSSVVRLKSPRKVKSRSSSSSISRVIEPRDVDILCGKSKECVTHPGNKLYRKYIDDFQGRYALCTNKQSKMSVTKEIVNSISRTSRFLRFNAETQAYEELSHLEARDKTSHALRTACKRVSKQQKKLGVKTTNTTMTTIKPPTAVVSLSNISTSPIQHTSSSSCSAIQHPRPYPQYHRHHSMPPLVARSSSANSQFQPLSLHHEDQFDDNTCFGDLLSFLDGGSE